MLETNLADNDLIDGSRSMPSALLSGSTRLWLPAALLLAVSAAGCRDGTGPENEPVATIVIGGVPSAPLLPGTMVQLTATPLSEGGATLVNRKITWQTSDMAIATVSSDGLVTATGIGAVTITAESEGKNAEAVLDVRPGGSIGPQGGTLALFDGAVTILVPHDAVHQSVAITARPTTDAPETPRLVSGTSYEIGPEGLLFQEYVTLSLRYDPAKLSADPTDPVLQLYIWAGHRWAVVRWSQADAITRTVTGLIPRTGTYAVISTPVQRIEIREARVHEALYSGNSRQLAGWVFDAAGDTLFSRSVRWSSSDTARATVDSSGKVMARSAGTVTISASVDGKAAHTTLTLLARPVPAWHQTADWVTFQGNARRTGYVAATLDPTVFRLLWQKTVAPALTPVATGDARLFVSASGLFGIEKRLFTLEAATGNVLWSYNFGDIHSVHAPAYANGRVYVTTGGHQDSFLWCFDAATGALQFRSSYENQWSRWYAPAIVDDVVYMAGGVGGGMYAFNAVDGRQNWFASTATYSDWTPSVDDGRVYSYIGSTNPRLSIVNALSGEALHHITDANYVWSGLGSTPVLGSRNNVLVTQSGRLISFDVQNRSIAWERSESFRGNVAVDDARIYVHNGSAVDARREADGSLLWSWTPPFGGRPVNTMVVTDNLLFVSSATEYSTVPTYTFAVDLASGKQVWSYPAAGQLALSADGILFIAQSNSILTAIAVR